MVQLKGLKISLNKRRRTRLRNASIYVIIGVLIVGLGESGMSQWLAQIKPNPFNYSIDPLASAEVEKATQPIVGQQGAPLSKKDRVDRTPIREEKDKRTTSSKTFVNADGSRTVKTFGYPQHFEKDGKLLDLAPKISPDYSYGKTGLNGQPAIALANSQPSAYELTTGEVSSKVKPFKDGIDISYGDVNISLKPQNSANPLPVKKKVQTHEEIIYTNAWKDTEVQYMIAGSAIKENVILRSSKAPSEFKYRVSGAKLYPHPTEQGAVAIEGVDPAKFFIAPLSVSLNQQGIIGEQRANWAINGDTLTLALDKEWYKKLPLNAFPVVIDPSFYSDAGGEFGNFISYDSNNYKCNSYNCDPNIGSLLVNGVKKSWRVMARMPFDQLHGKKVLGAHLHVVKAQRSYWTGYTGWQYVQSSWAPCFGFTCWHNDSMQHGAGANTDDWTDITRTVAWMAGNDNPSPQWGGWMILRSNEGVDNSYKQLDPYQFGMSVTYDTPTPVATPVEPADKQVTINTQPTLRVNTVTDGDGEKVQYYFRVSTAPDAETGAVINSGWIDATQWTVPEGILQDGTTYYWHTYTKGGEQTNPNWVRSFKVDLRTGKDSTQSYDTVGPIGIDLATGNATTSNESHSMSALGGSLGVSMDYNSPTRSESGLRGQYWNVATNYNFANGAPTSAPTLSRTDSKIDFNWANGSPGSGINSDWFYGKWKGYITVPTTGNYTFGVDVDDKALVKVNGSKVAERTCCAPSGRYDGSTTVALTAGQVVPIEVDMMEIGGGAGVWLWAKGPSGEQIVPQSWLRTAPKQTSNQYGLTGHYYTDDGKHVFPTTDTSRLMMVRKDTSMNMNWGLQGPAPGLQVDNFMVRWTGYITAPSTGTYNIGADSDDGLRIKLGTTQTIIDSWTETAGRRWSGSVSLTAGQQVPITVEYFEKGGGASIKMLIRGNGMNEQEMPASWLSPKASALPDAWNLGMDVDGNVNYERLRVSGQNIILEDSTRSTHEYTWTGSGYKPPVNEHGHLTRNANNTYTLLDSDGRTYVFDAEGKLTSLTSPTDDRKPAAIKYEYAGDPSRLIKITDGVNAERFMSLHYKGVNENDLCSAASGFDAIPAGMLCAAKTSDGDITKLHYKSGQLSRVEKPGNDYTDYGYDDLGRIVNIRDTVANDAVAATVRVNDESVLTQLGYDSVGRVSSVKAPAATAGASRLTHTFDYLPNTTQFHILGASEPNGFSKKIEYDSLLRTTRETDLTGKSTFTSWDSVKDLQRSTTDATGLKSTTIYDDDDRPIESYGPAPAEWFSENGLPLAAYVDQIPKTSTGYDEGITGLAVAYTAANAQPQETTLHNGQVMKRGDSRWSIDRRFRFIYQSDGNIVLYGPNGSLWASNTTGKASDKLGMQSDGNLVLYNGSTPVWATGTNGGSSSHLIVQNDGNTVMYSSTGTKWATNTGGWSPAGPSNASLVGAPLQHSTNIANDGTISKSYGSTSPIPGRTGAWGMRMTGHMRLPTTGTWKFRINANDGVRVWVDDVMVHDSWKTDSLRSREFSYNNVKADGLRRVRIEYYHVNGDATFMLYATPPAGTETNQVAKYFSPGYGLTTSQTAYDKQQGDVTTKTVYSKPEYGIVDKTILDPTGQNLQTTATYEAPGAGYLRQTSKTLPGGGTVNYQHYGPTETRDNPCTPEIETFRQAGRSKGKVEADPDGTGPQVGRKSETIYNESGDVVATRYNSDAWTCTEYDARGRVTKTTIPAVGNSAGRTIENNYTVDGNPLVTTTSDNAGTIRVENDLLGNTLKYTDAKGKVATNMYDNFGKLISRTSVVGKEDYVYDSFDRLVTQKLDGVTFATVTYDEFSRVKSVAYPAGISLSEITRDTLGRENSDTFTLADGTKLTDQITRVVSGDIVSGVENGTTKNYTYDNAGRLTGATIGSNIYKYDFAAPDANCSTLAGNNPNAAKNGNRTKLTVNGQSTTYCYDYADRLISSSDQSLTTPVYDAHGNTISLGTGATKTSFGYDASDRNTSMSAGDKATAYSRDAQDRIIGRDHKVASVTKSSVSYSFTGSGDSPDAILDASGKVLQKYVTLPGDVLVTIKIDTQSAGATTYSLPNVHGDVFATVNADGILQNTYMTGPFGEVLPNKPVQPISATTAMANPSNTVGGTTWNYVGQHQKLTDTETTYISGGVAQMGARLYVANLGRFLSVDSIEGGTDNNYVYANDPVNQFDLDGKAVHLVAIGLGVLVGLAARAAAPHVARIAVRYVARPTTNFIVKRAAPYLTKKATAFSAKRRAIPAPKVLWQRAKHVINHNNYFRVGKHRGAFRVAAGPARHYHVNSIGRGHSIKRHVHIEWGKVLYQNHKKNYTKCRGWKCW